MRQDKFLYFRAQATDENDQSSSDSACYPVSSLMGMHPGGDTTLILFFKPMVREHHLVMNQMLTQVLTIMIKLV